MRATIYSLIITLNKAPGTMVSMMAKGCIGMSAASAVFLIFTTQLCYITSIPEGSIETGILFTLNTPLSSLQEGLS